ncbi:MAG: lytic transglycosylase domain-containing protein [Betaproteobacteria bacterium]|nr:lytic transglycosylase domain-containing protein [Betaproteobacteria bacterium]
MNYFSSFKIPKFEKLDAVFDGVRTTMSIVGLLTVLMLSLRMLDQGVMVTGTAEAVIASQNKIEDANSPIGLSHVAAQIADPHQRMLARYLSTTFRIAPEAAAELVAAAHAAGRIVGLDPILLLAVMAVESRFNPIAESDMGAKGLMQIIPKYHLDKLATHGGEAAVLDPWVNILVGSQILREYASRGGNLATGLQQYNGAANDPTMRYSERVFAEKLVFERFLRDNLLQYTKADI